MGGFDFFLETRISGSSSKEQFAMEYSELITARYSVRAYRPDPVEDEKLQAVLEVARLAPTAANRQPIQLVVMHTAGREEEIGKIYRRP
jgi:nitroreductase